MISLWLCRLPQRLMNDIRPIIGRINHRYERHLDLNYMVMAGNGDKLREKSFEVLRKVQTFIYRLNARHRAAGAFRLDVSVSIWRRQNTARWFYNTRLPIVALIITRFKRRRFDVGTSSLSNGLFKSTSNRRRLNCINL